MTSRWVRVLPAPFVRWSNPWGSWSSLGSEHPRDRTHRGLCHGSNAEGGQLRHSLRPVPAHEGANCSSSQQSRWNRPPKPVVAAVPHIFSLFHSLFLQFLKQFLLSSTFHLLEQLPPHLQLQVFSLSSDLRIIGLLQFLSFPSSCRARYSLD